MRLKLNGEVIETTSVSVESLLDELAFERAVVATAVNGEFVPRSGRAAVLLKDGDSVEVISPRQGG